MIYKVVKLNGEPLGSLNLETNEIRDNRGRLLFRVQGNQLVSVLSRKTFTVMDDGRVHDDNNIQVGFIEQWATTKKTSAASSTTKTGSHGKSTQHKSAKFLFIVIPLIILVIFFFNQNNKGTNSEPSSDNSSLSFDAFIPVNTQKGGIKAPLPETITTYELNDEIKKQTVEDIEIIKRDTDKDSEYIQCVIHLKDDNIIRTIYADLYLTKYETGGWLIDDWMPYQKEETVALKGPDEGRVTTTLQERYDFDDVTQEGSDIIEGCSFERKYTVDEDYRYLKRKGTITYYADLLGGGADNDYRGQYNWNDYVDVSELSANWNISGNWSGVQVDGHMSNNMPYKFDVTIDSFDLETANREWEAIGNNDPTNLLDTFYEIGGTGKLYWPAWDHSINDYSGEYGSYNFLEMDISKQEYSEKKKTLALILVFGQGSIEVEMTPDKINASGRDLQGSYNFEVSK